MKILLSITLSLFTMLGLIAQDLPSLRIIAEDYIGDLGIGKVKSVKIVMIKENSEQIKTTLKKGDLILAINDMPIHSTKDLIKNFTSPLKIEYMRKGKKYSDEIVLAYAPVNFASTVEYSKSGKLESWEFDDHSQILMSRGDLKSYSFENNEGGQITIEYPLNDTINAEEDPTFSDKLFMIENLQKDQKSSLDKIKSFVLLKSQR